MAERRSSVRPRYPSKWNMRIRPRSIQILEDDAMSFRFVGSTICYAFMQVTGIVNDRVVDCFRYPDCC
jgi:3-methyladenine DNA glycosylase Tag